MLYFCLGKFNKFEIETLISDSFKSVILLTVSLCREHAKIFIFDNCIPPFNCNSRTSDYNFDKTRSYPETFKSFFNV